MSKSKILMTSDGKVKCRETRQTEDSDPDKVSSFRYLLIQIEHDAFVALERCANAWGKNEDGYRKRQYELFAVLCAYAKEIAQNEGQREKLRSRECWKKLPPGPAHRKTTLLAARYMLGATGTSDGNLYEQARIYAKVVDHFIEAKIDPAEIPRALELAHGIHALEKRLRTQEAEEMEAASHSTDDHSSGEEAQAENDDETDFKPITMPDAVTRRTKDKVVERRVCQPETFQMPRFDPSRHVLIDGGGNQREILNLADEEEIWVLLKCSQRHPEWKDIRAIETKVP